MNASLHKPKTLLTPSHSKGKDSAPPPNTQVEFKKFNPAATGPLVEQLESQSSLITKLDAALRFQLHDALVNRDPPTYRAVFEKFKLADHGVSYTAFYYYARRIRISAAMAESARALLPEGAHLDDVLPGLLAEKVLEAAIDEAASPRKLQRLVDAFRMVSTTNFARQRLAVQLGDLKRELDRKSMDENIAVFKKYLRVTAAENAAVAAARLATVAESAPQAHQPVT